MKRRERGCIPFPDLLDSDERNGQGSGPSLCLQMYNPDTFHKRQLQALPVQRKCSELPVPGLSLQRMSTTNVNDGSGRAPHCELATVARCCSISATISEHLSRSEASCRL